MAMEIDNGIQVGDDFLRPFRLVGKWVGIGGKGAAGDEQQANDTFHILLVFIVLLFVHIDTS